jgi:hypothetical protein
LGLGVIGFKGLTVKKVGFSNRIINNNKTGSVFLDAGSISGSVSSKVINAINNFASNSGGKRSGNVGVNSARLITSGGNAISSGGGGLIKGRSAT